MRTVKKESTEHDNTLGRGKAELNMETIIKILPWKCLRMMTLLIQKTHAWTSREEWKEGSVEDIRVDFQ